MSLKKIRNVNNMYWNRKKYIKKSIFMQALFTVFGSYSYDDLITLRDGLNVLISKKAINGFNEDEYIKTLKGYVTYGKK